MSAKKKRVRPVHYVGQATGGIIGMLAGVAIGLTAVPYGMVLGGVAGAVAGWWTGRVITERRRRATDAP